MGKAFIDELRSYNCKLDSNRISECQIIIFACDDARSSAYAPP
jgi:hypothetical protein